MIRSLAASIGSLAMAIVVIRGLVRGEPAGDVAVESMIALIAFAIIGAIAGWILDYLLKDSLKRSFEARVDWYRKGLAEQGHDMQTKTGGD